MAGTPVSRKNGPVYLGNKQSGYQHGLGVPGARSRIHGTTSGLGFPICKMGMMVYPPPLELLWELLTIKGPVC